MKKYFNLWPKIVFLAALLILVGLLGPLTQAAKSAVSQDITLSEESAVSQDITLSEKEVLDDATLAAQDESFNGPSITLTVLKAGYSDLNSDGVEDDIFIDIQLALPQIKVGTIKIYLELDIIFPSGLLSTTAFQITVRNWPTTILPVMRIVGYYVAFETGWYNANFQSLVFGYFSPSYSSWEHLFDPPGSKQGGMPDYSIDFLES
jgi:hypothetical protein